MRMMLRRWEEIPEWMRTPEVGRYYDVLNRKRGSLFAKRIFDVVMAGILLVLLSPVFGVIAFLIERDSKGGVLYRQERVTSYGKRFRIHKFRTMAAGSDRMGTQVTLDHDSRITRVGTFLRKYRLDELPQLLDVLNGNMSFVGVRPEVPKYVDCYTEKMKATLLLPAGITSEASIRYKDEARLLAGAMDAAEADRIYVERVLPGKMQYNLQALRRFGIWNDLRVMVWTVGAVFKQE